MYNEGWALSTSAGQTYGHSEDSLELEKEGELRGDESTYRIDNWERQTPQSIHRHEEETQKIFKLLAVTNHQGKEFCRVKVWSSTRALIAATKLPGSEVMTKEGHGHPGILGNVSMNRARIISIFPWEDY